MPRLPPVASAAALLPFAVIPLFARLLGPRGDVKSTRARRQVDGGAYDRGIGTRGSIVGAAPALTSGRS